MKRFNFFKFLILFTLVLLSLILINAEVKSKSCIVHAQEISQDTTQKTTKSANQWLKALVDSICTNTDKKTKPLADRLRNFYEPNNYQLSWSTKEGVSKQSEELLETVRQAPEEGLKVNSYPLEKATKWHQKMKEATDASEKQWAKLDYWLTKLYLSYAEDLSAGRFKPEKVDTTFKRYPKTIDLAHHLRMALQDNQIAASLHDLSPKLELYDLLKEQLVIYKKLRKSNNWDQIEGEFLLKTGEYHEQVPAIYERLAITQELDTNTVKLDSTNYTKEIAAGVEKFQERHGLAVDGVIGPNTLAAMNQSVDKKVRQIKMNMERLRWMPDDLGDWYILVNVPAFELQLIDKQQEALRMNVVTGKELWPTPLFSDTMSYLSFSPTWTPTINIIFDDLIPRIQKNPNYFDRKGIVVYDSWQNDANTVDPSTIRWSSFNKSNFPYRMTQKPGPKNALGQVKFMFPNTMSIYLHDTPHESFFEEPDRDLSHGCVRVADPLALATYILAQQGESWDREKVKEYMNKTSPENVSLTKKIPVHLVYWTVWVDENGTLNFSEDIYGLDESQSELM